MKYTKYGQKITASITKSYKCRINQVINQFNDDAAVKKNRMNNSTESIYSYFCLTKMSKITSYQALLATSNSVKVITFQENVDHKLPIYVSYKIRPPTHTQFHRTKHIHETTKRFYSEVNKVR